MIVKLEDVTYYKIASRNLLIDVVKEDIENNMNQYSNGSFRNFLSETRLTNFVDIVKAGFKKETVPEYMFFKIDETKRLVEFFTGLPLGDAIFCYQKEFDKINGPSIDIIQKVKNHDEIYCCLRNFTSKELGTELLEVVEKYKNFYKAGKRYQENRIIKQVYLRNLPVSKLF